MSDSKTPAIVIFSSANPEVSEDVTRVAEGIGKYLAEKGVRVLTGGSLGVPGVVIRSAKENGAHTEGYFPDHDPVSHSKRFDNQSIEYFDTYRFIPSFSGRSLAMIEAADAAIVLNGRIGTLSEFCMAVEEALPTAVIAGTGGISDELERIVSIANKEFPGKVIFDSDYKNAIDLLIEEVMR